MADTGARCEICERQFKNQRGVRIHQSKVLTCRNQPDLRPLEPVVQTPVNLPTQRQQWNIVTFNFPYHLIIPFLLNVIVLALIMVENLSFFMAAVYLLDCYFYAPCNPEFDATPLFIIYAKELILDDYIYSLH